MSPYINLGTPGTNSHHYAVQSFRCNSGLTLIQFINGNANPQTGHPENCVAGTIVNTNPWVKTGGATGVSFYRG